MYGGQSTHIPIKVNMSGVMPVIFASALALHPGTIGGFFPNLYNPDLHPFAAPFLGMFQHQRLGVCGDLFAAHHRVQLFLCGDAV